MTWKSNFILLHRIFPVFLLKSPKLIALLCRHVQIEVQLLTQIMMGYNVPALSFWIMVTQAFADL